MFGDVKTCVNRQKSMQSKQNAILARQTTFRIPSTCPNVSSSSHVPPPKIVIAGIGDSGTRGVRNLLYKLGVQMCSIVNPASDNECSMLPHNNIYSLLACTRGHVYLASPSPYRSFDWLATFSCAFFSSSGSTRK